jgi:hypothetical protein
MNVRFCPACRSLILSDFRFCPYCGASVAVKGPGLSEALAGPFEDMGSPGAARRGVSDLAGTSVFKNAEASLERLEADMDLLLDALEKEGRSSN